MSKLEEINEMKLKMIDSLDHFKQHFLLIMIAEMEKALKGNPRLMDRLRNYINDVYFDAKIKLNRIL